MTARKVINLKKFNRITRRDNSTVGSVVQYGKFNITVHPAVIYRNYLYVKMHQNTNGERITPVFFRYDLKEVKNSLKYSTFGFVFSRGFYGN
jgi:hypothetical protein